MTPNRFCDKFWQMLIWYARLELSDTLCSLHDKAARGRLIKRVQKAQVRTVTEHKFPAVAKGHGDAFVIKDMPPLIYHHPHIDASRANLEHGLDLHRQSLSAERRALLDRYPADGLFTEGRWREQCGYVVCRQTLRLSFPGRPGCVVFRVKTGPMTHICHGHKAPG